MVLLIRKKCPRCASKAVKLYQNKTVDGRRKWVPTAWICTDCGHVYTVASDTLMYGIGGDPYDESYNEECQKCGLKLARLYRHKNPVHGKQEWISMGWYCNRCRYSWIDKKHIKVKKTV